MIRRLFAIAVMAALPLHAAAQFPRSFFDGLFGSREQVETRRAKQPLEFDYNVHADWFFVNNEYGASDESYDPSRTMTGIRVTPSLGLRYTHKAGVHRLMGGIDLLKEFGANPVGRGAESSVRQENWDIFREITLFYQFSGGWGKTSFTGVAGAYPRYLTEGKYTTAILSDKVRFYDNNLEGLLLKFRRPRSYYEVGADWNGKYGTDRRERFNIFSYGDVYLAKWLHFGWQAMFQHYAGSVNVKGVVDDHFLNPWLKFDFTPYVPLQEFSLQTGAFAAYQFDRRAGGSPVFPLGADVVLDVRNWGVGVRNEAYYGKGLLPFWFDTDAAGNMYGPDLYYRSTFWRMDSIPFYDRLEVYWTPRITDFLRAKVSAVFHFGDAYFGWQQIATLIFDLDALRHPRRKEAEVVREVPSIFL